MTLEAYESLRAKGFSLAGGLADLRQRACVYHHLYADSGKRNVFPLIAAHGALWASGYFKKGMLGGQILSLHYLFSAKLRSAKLASLSIFADKFRDINRRVCAESYAIHHYTKNYADNSFIRSIIGHDFVDSLYECHAANASNSSFAKEQREKLFRAFFSWEQENIVAPAVIEAYENFHWSAIKYMALRPRIDFAYFGKNFHLQFDNFAAKDERIKRGLQAYQRAEEVGLKQVEHSISRYQLMPEIFHNDPDTYYKELETTHG